MTIYITPQPINLPTSLLTGNGRSQENGSFSLTFPLPLSALPHGDGTYIHIHIHPNRSSHQSTWRRSFDFPLGHTYHPSRSGRQFRTRTTLTVMLSTLSSGHRRFFVYPFLRHGYYHIMIAAYAAFMNLSYHYQQRVQSLKLWRRFSDF